jgi:hypothetical protein
MKNDKAMNLTTTTKLDLAIAEAQGKVTVKRLKTRGPRKGETHYTGAPKQGGGRVLGAVGDRDSNPAGWGQAATGARWSGGHGQRGIDAVQVDNLSGVKRTFAKQAAADRRAAARDRAADKLDNLLADLRG